jgi:RNA polymerase sigma factor (sigma-70 family)
VEFYAVRMNMQSDTDIDDPLEMLFRTHYARLVRALTLVSGSREMAADAVQEAFVKAHLHWWRIKRYDDPVGWIRRVAINRLRDVHRRSAREDSAVARLVAQADAAISSIGNPGEAGAVAPGGGFIDVQMSELVAGLPRQQRLAVTLFYVEELTVAEVARAMSISLGAVKFHLHQGRERLRTAFPGGSGARDET